MSQFWTFGVEWKDNSTQCFLTKCTTLKYQRNTSDWSSFDLQINFLSTNNNLKKLYSLNDHLFCIAVVINLSAWTFKTLSFAADGCVVCSTLTGLISKSNACCQEATASLPLIPCVAVWDVRSGFVRHGLRIGASVSFLLVDVWTSQRQIRGTIFFFKTTVLVCICDWKQVD